MSNFWNSCFDDLMSTAFRRDKDKSDSKSKFQVTKLYGFMQQTLSSKPLLNAVLIFTLFICLCGNRKWLWTPT